MDLQIGMLELMVGSQGLLLARFLRALCADGKDHLLLLYVISELIRLYVSAALCVPDLLPGPPYPIALIPALAAPALCLYACHPPGRLCGLRPRHLAWLLPYPLLTGLYAALSDPAHRDFEILAQLNQSGALPASTLAVCLLNTLCACLYCGFTLLWLGRCNAAAGWPPAARTLSRRLLYLGLAGGAICLAIDVLRIPHWLTASHKMLAGLLFTFLSFNLIAGHLLQRTRTVHSRVPAADSTRQTAPTAAETMPDPRTKYEKSGLQQQQSEQLWRELQRYFDREKPYLDTGFNLATLSQRLNVSKQIVSQLINHHSHVNFYQFVDAYRIRHATRLLCEQGNEGRKLLDIALSSGYANQSTFYGHFKKHKGMTPKEYRQHHHRKTPPAADAMPARINKHIELRPAGA